MITIYYNARCSKCREALDLICDLGEKPEIIEYMKDTPSETELKALIAKIGIKPEALVRKTEDIYKDNYKDKKLTDAQWIKAMVKHPALIQRPIVVKDDVAVIGRPAETIERLLANSKSKTKKAKK